MEFHTKPQAPTLDQTTVKIDTYPEGTSVENVRALARQSALQPVMTVSGSPYYSFTKIEDGCVVRATQKDYPFSG